MEVALLKVKKRVENFLTNYPHLRDNDEKLIANIWTQDLMAKGVDIKKISAMHLMTRFAEGQLTNPESVRRTRQKIQQNNENLRGKSYKERGNKQEVIVNELEEIDNE